MNLESAPLERARQRQAEMPAALRPQTPVSGQQGAPRSDAGDDPAITLPPAATAPQMPEFEEFS